MTTNAGSAVENPVTEARILLVDDNTANLQVLRESLEGLGCKILVAKNGMAALAIVAKAHPDLILLDIMMPEMDGYGLTAEIRRLEAGTGRLTPILAITASEFDLSADTAKERGFSGHMLKPLDPEVLEKKLADLVRFADKVTTDSPPRINSEHWAKVQYPSCSTCFMIHARSAIAAPTHSRFTCSWDWRKACSSHLQKPSPERRRCVAREIFHRIRCGR
jgi:CheY-like chemotaxis protein